MLLLGLILGSVGVLLLRQSNKAVNAPIVKYSEYIYFTPLKAELIVKDQNTQEEYVKNELLIISNGTANITDIETLALTHGGVVLGKMWKN